MGQNPKFCQKSFLKAPLTPSKRKHYVPKTITMLDVKAFKTKLSPQVCGHNWCDIGVAIRDG